MEKCRWSSVVCLLSLLCFAGCSSSSSPTQQQLAEAQVEEVMSVVVLILEELNPFNPAPPLNTAIPLGDCVVHPESDDFCLAGGDVQQCGESMFVFNGCSAIAPGVGSISVNGTLVYTAENDWPTGQRDVTIVSENGEFAYDMDFDGSDIADVDVLGDDYVAACLVDLVTVDATCEVV